MPISFTAHAAGVDDDYCLVAAVAEFDNGTGRALFFQAAQEPPDEQEVRLGMDSYCLVTESQGTAYACVRELTISGQDMRVVIHDEALADLGLDDGVFMIQLAVPPQSRKLLRQYLRRILTYGRPEAHPPVLRL